MQNINEIYSTLIWKFTHDPGFLGDHYYWTCVNVFIGKCIYRSFTLGVNNYPYTLMGLLIVTV